MVELTPYTRLQGLYDGEGEHLGGIYPPLKVNNVLTDFYKNNLAERSFYRKLQVIEPTGHNVGLVFMAPLGGVPDRAVWPEVLGLMVQALDAGLGVIVHGDRHEAVDWITGQALVFSGGGRT